MTYTLGTRHNIPRLEVIQVTSYISKFATRCPGMEIEQLKYRYAFRQQETNRHFVYTGRQYNFKEGEVIDLRGTVKKELDEYGYIRLKAIRRVELQKELSL